MHKLRKMKGFTLIELIVVVLIIGVLALIASVAYNQFVGKSRAAAAQADAVQLRTAVDAYAAQNDVSPADALKKTLADTSAHALTALATLGYSGTDVVYYDGANGAIVIKSGNHGATIKLGATLSSPSVITATDPAPATAPTGSFPMQGTW